VRQAAIEVPEGMQGGRFLVPQQMRRRPPPRQAAGFDGQSHKRVEHGFDDRDSGGVLAPGGMVSKQVGPCAGQSGNDVKFAK
jgi:hypothetical protein